MPRPPRISAVDPGRWQAEFSAVLDRIASRLGRHEPLRRAGALMAGMVSGLDRKNCPRIAEHRGDSTPDGLQHLLSRAKWDADGVRDDLRDYVVDAFGDPGAIGGRGRDRRCQERRPQRRGAAPVLRNRGPD